VSNAITRKKSGGGETKYNTLEQSGNADDDFNRVSERSIQKTRECLAEFQR
jgi:hypothetical protein